jgi:hypothetical protein
MPGKRSFINIVELSRWRIDMNSANLDTIRSGMERAIHLMPYRQRSSYPPKSRVKYGARHRMRAALAIAQHPLA